MTSTAISAQGSTLGIASATAPGPVTLSSGSVLTNVATFITSAAHNLVNGAQVTFAAGAVSAGTAASVINGQAFNITVVSTTSFSIQLPSVGLTVTTATGTVTGTTYLNVGNLKTFSGLDGQASEIDVTNMQSSAKEIRLGLVDYGQIQLELDHNIADVGQAQALVQYKSGALSPFILTLPNGNTAAFQAFVRKFSLQGGVDQVVKRSLDLRITGPVTWC